MTTSEPYLTKRFSEAFEYAFHLHRTQVRKGTAVPYIAHLMAVAGMVIENGGGEDEAIAGLLHDAVEDQGGQATLTEVRRRFGDRVADIVWANSDTDVEPKPAWRPRKEAYLDHLRTAPPPVLLVSAADKLHNARAVLADYRHLGEALWDRFNGGRDGTLWYYRELANVFAQTGPDALAAELDRVVGELETLAAPAV
ncbi:MAG TPA: HD domain-containing protein [Anaerolineaceae bacterium]|nr:HD domain-containing protein [Anaerolineaceae bacterium]